MQNPIKYLLPILLLCTPVLATSPAWNVDASQYEYDMSLTGTLEMNRQPITSSGNLVGAFVNGECRGVAETSEFAATGDMVFSMPIYSNVSTGESVTFKAYLVSEDQIYTISDSLDFIADQINGDHYNPVVLTLLMPPPDWSVNPADFEYDLSFTGTVTIDGIESVDENDMVGAFVNGELRGFSALAYYTAFDRWFASFPIYSNTASGEVVSFQIYDASAGILSPANESLTFTANDVVGDFTNPTILSLGEITAGDPWTILVYLDGDNDLEDAAIDDINEMESVVLPDGINVIVQIDRIDGYDTSNGDWTDTRRYEITHDTNSATINSPLIDGSLGELNMGDPQTLADFITWGVETYPAENYMLIMWNHGGGWRKKNLVEISAKRTELTNLNTGIVKAICWDETDGGDNLEMREVKSALASMNIATGKTFNIMGFDACLMGLMEVAYGIKDYVTDAVVFSQETEPGDGWDYSSWLTSLSAAPESDSKTIAGYIVDSYAAFYADGYNTTQSALDMTTLDNLKIKIDNFANSFSGEWSVIDAAADAAFKFNTAENYADLKQFMQYCATNLSDGTAATDVVNAVDQTIIHNAATGNLMGATGLNIYLRRYLDTEGKYYYSAPYCDFAAESDWTGFLSSYQDYMRSTSIVTFPEDPVGFEENITLSWKTIDADGDSAGFFRTQSSSAHTGDYVLALKTWYNQMNDWLITPKIQIQDLAEISFWARSTDAGWLEDFNVKVSTTGSEVSDFTTSLATVTDLPNSWTQFTYDLSAYSGQEIYVAIQGVSFDENYLFIDDISLVNNTSANQSISSTSTGGKWSESTTWVGGIVPTATNDVIIEGPVIVDVDAACQNLLVESGMTLENYSYFDRTLVVSGSVTNKGLIQDGETYHTFTLDIKGDLTNNGLWQNSYTICSGSTDQYLAMDPDARFSTGRLENTDSASAVIAGSDLTFSKGFTIDLGDDYSRNGQLILPSNSGLNIALDSAFVEFSWIRGNGNKITLKNESALNSQVHIQDAVLTGIVNIDGYSVTFEGNSVVLEDTLQNASNAGRNLLIKGLFTNKGVIRDNPFGYPSYLWIEVLGDIVNSGQWINTKTTLNGTLNQTVTLSDNEIIYADFVLEAVIGTGSYQWYQNDIAISGETNDNLFLNSLEAGNTYYCSTNEGNSRSISIVGDDVGTADWEMITTLPSSVRDIHFTDNLVGFAVGGGSIYSDEGGGKVYKTVDGGSTWQELSLPADPPFSSIYFTDPMNGWVVGGRTSECRIFHTSNGGTDWTEQVTAVSNRPTSVFFVNTSNGWITNDAGKIQHTDDGGANWSVQNSTISEHVIDIFFVDENTGWAGAQYATILHTSDGGNTWNTQNSTIPRPSSDNRNFGFMDFINANTGWVCGDNGWIVNTSDGGMNWTLQETPVTGIHLRGVDFIDGANGFAVGSMGTVLKTSDGGASWEKSAFSNSNWLSDICFINDSTAFISDGEGNIYKYSQETGSELLADFTANIKSGSVPLTVQFSDLSSGAPISWEWDFGDGNSATQQNPQHIYETAGTYSVSLTVSDGSIEDTHVKTDYIIVLEPVDEPDGWFMQNPFPTANDLNDVAIIDENTIIAIGPNGLIMKTVDSGVSWVYPQSNTLEDLNDVFFPTYSEGYIVGNNPTGEPGVMLKTTDAGETWTSIDVNINDNLNSVFFIDENTGWIVGGNHLTSTYKDGYISKTTDGGQTWTSQTPAVNDVVYKVQFIDANTGWIGGYSYFATTTNGGDTWNEVTVPVSDFYPYNFQFINQNEGWLPLNYNGLYHTTDGGNSWTEITSFSGDYPSEVYFTDPSTGYISSDDILYRTTDGGISWTEQIDLPGYSDYNIKGLDFNNNNGWFVTLGGKIYKTDTGTWSEVSSSVISDNITNAYFIDETTGWVIGYMDNIWKTADGGYTWTEQTTPSHYTLEGIDFVDANTGWAVGHAPYGGDAKIYHTEDGGTNWIDQSSNTTNLLWDVDFIDSNHGWAVGYQGTIIYTSDGGASWSSQSSGTTTILEDVFFLNTHTGWICGANGTILHTTDGGNSWNQQTNSNTNNLNGIYFIDETNGFAVGAEATLLGTHDGGLTWDELSSGSWDSPSYNSIQFADDIFGWIAGDDGSILITENVGESWENQISNTSIDLEAISFTNSTTGWAVGENGAILKTSTGGKVPINDIEPNIDNSELVIRKYRLHQNYPNPFNPTTTIRYELPETGLVSLAIYNIYGQKIRELVNKTQYTGQYQAIWDGKNQNGISVSSGMYICYINVIGKTDSYSTGIRMLLMK